MSDFQGETSPHSSDGDRYTLDDDYEGGPAWETAPDNDDEDGDESDDNDAFSEPPEDHDPNDGRENEEEGGGYDEGEADGDFEDAWLDDYLPGESVQHVEDRRLPLHHIEEIDNLGKCDNRTASGRSLSLEEDTSPSLMVVDADGGAVVSVSSPRLAGLTALEGSNSIADSRRKSSAPLNSESSSSAQVHPIPGSMPAEKNGRRDLVQMTPLSPSTSPYKRANSVYTAPSSITTKIFQAQQSTSDNSHPGLPCPRSSSQFWDSADTTKKSSRLLDEWKRKELWQDLKRAEETIVSPTSDSSHQDISPSRIPMYKRAFSDARLDTLLQTLQKEVTAKPAQTKESRRSSLRRPESAKVRSTPGDDDDKDYRPSSARTEASHETPTQRTLSSPTLTLDSDPVHSLLPKSAVASVSLSEYEQLQREKGAQQTECLLLRTEVEKARDTSAMDQARIRQLNEKLQQMNEKLAYFNDKQLQFDTVERENRSLREDTQKHKMQALSSSELVKTLRDQLALTSKSEEQLKLQTKQLMEQNQTLQSDLLEKIAAETTKFQKMARLSAENESLVEELERKENAVSDRVLEQRQRTRGLIIRRLLRSKVRDVLRSTMFQWSGTARRETAVHTQALTLLSNVDLRLVLKMKAVAFNKLKRCSITSVHIDTTRKFQASLDAAKQEAKTHRVLLGLMHLDHLTDHWERRQAAKTFSKLKHVQREHSVLTRSLELGMSKLQLVLLARDKMTTRRALSKWQFGAKRVSNHENVGRAQQLEANLTEAKECVFSLSRAKTKLEEKLQAARDEVQRLTGELTESGSELQLVKHGFVTTVIRDVERAWLRAVLTQWRIQTHVSAVTKELRLQVEMAELKASERDKYSKSLDDYSRVLRSDLERFQFFSLDKRITVDVLSKKLLREEERYRHMEERHVALEEKAHALKSQLASFVEWDGLALPFSVLALCKDAAVANLRDIFLLHAAGNTGIVEAGGITKEINGETPAPRLAMPSLVRLLEYSTLLEEEVIEREAIAERLARHLPPYAVERGLLFADFITGLNQFLTEVLASSNTKHEQLKRFWSSLLSLVGTSHVPNGIHIPVGEIGSTGSRSSAQSGEKSETGNSWAGRLSDDILQNQEKLLAMLEHETAVVERAVMDKVSLKHAYPASEHSSAGSVSRVGSCGATTFLEYQCDPLLPPEPGKVSTSPVDVSGTAPSSSAISQVSGGTAQNATSSGPTAEAYANWHLAPQVRDLFLAFHSPLLKLLVHYSAGHRTPAFNNQYCLSSAAVLRMLTDLKLHPTFLSQDMVQALFNRYRETSDAGASLLAPQGFTLLVGSCALDLYARSLAESQRKSDFLLSAREVLLSFFNDLGLVAESDVPPATQLCFVGLDIEAMLWPLFEYYANSADAAGNISSPPHTAVNDSRVGMTASTFERFMSDIAGKSSSESQTIFRRVMQSCSSKKSTTGANQVDRSWRMHLDEFYIAISYVQVERSPGTTYATPGEAVRQWLQQTQ